MQSETAAQGLPEEIIEKTYRAMIAAFIEYELEQHAQAGSAAVR